MVECYGVNVRIIVVFNFDLEFVGEFTWNRVKKLYMHGADAHGMFGNKSIKISD